MGGWLPDQDALEGWLEKLAQQVRMKPNDAPLHPAVEGLRELIDRDSVVRLYSVAGTVRKTFVREGTYYSEADPKGEVSSCVIRPELRPGRRLQKGEEIGHFQYGGSSHCLVFRPGAVREFALEAIPDPHTGSAPLVRVGARLATAGG